MSNVRQLQRRALEAVKPEKLQPVIAGPFKTYYLGDQQLYVAGISRGIGTCSDLHNVNILVLSVHRTDVMPQINYEFCDFAALIRWPTPEEIQKTNLSSFAVCMIAEGLNPIESVGFKIRFSLSGKKELYYPI